MIHTVRIRPVAAGESWVEGDTHVTLSDDDAEMLERVRASPSLYRQVLEAVVTKYGARLQL